MSIFQVLSFKRLKKEAVNEIVARAKALDYGLEPGEVVSRQSPSGHWLIMPLRLHKWSILYEDGYPVDRECATLEFLHMREQYRYNEKGTSRGLFSPTFPDLEPIGYEVVALEWSLVAVISPDGHVTWGREAFDDLLTRVLHMDTEDRQLSHALQSQANDKLSIQWLSREGKKAMIKRED